uniref:Uncharacterized protein n=1 Tax=Nelumbo nucifera TaxID=4432 RepID=A0A822ZP82_NELNU|nr:TPA_asm: hypothetical protein HUJ06_003571 [Nelumbo nucifera]
MFGEEKNEKRGILGVFLQLPVMAVSRLQLGRERVSMNKVWFDVASRGGNEPFHELLDLSS